MASFKYPPTSLIALVLLLLNLAAFFVLLGGAAGLQKDRATVVQALNLYNSAPGSILSFGDLKPVSTNQNFISYEWYKAVFQAVTILLALGAFAAGMFYHSRIAFVGLFAALGVLFSDASNTFYYLYLQTHKNPALPQKVKREITAYFSGCIMSATLDFLLVIVMGLGAGVTPNTHAHTHTGPAAGVKDTTNGAGTAV